MIEQANSSLAQSPPNISSSVRTSRVLFSGHPVVIHHYDEDADCTCRRLHVNNIFCTGRLSSLHRCRRGFHSNDRVLGRSDSANGVSVFESPVLSSVHLQSSLRGRAKNRCSTPWRPAARIRAASPSERSRTSSPTRPRRRQRLHNLAILAQAIAPGFTRAPHCTV